MTVDLGAVQRRQLESIRRRLGATSASEALRRCIALCDRVLEVKGRGLHVGAAADVDALDVGFII